jgi:GNAT superfamily N-acetyltransferase
VRIRLATSRRDREDVQSLYDLLIEAPDEWAGGKQTLWIGRNGNGLACAFAAVLHWADLDVAYLSGVGVRPAWRGARLHNRMLRIRRDWAERHGIGALVTYVVPDNYASLKGLLNFGFKMRQIERGRWRGYHVGLMTLSTNVGSQDRLQEIDEAQRRMFR